MAQLIVRNIEDAVRDRLRELARRHGRSMEEFVRDILRDAVVNRDPAAERGLGSRIAERFAGLELDGGEGGGFEVPEWRGQVPQPAKFGPE